MKKIITLCIFVVSWLATMNAQTTKTLSKSINLAATKTIYILLPGAVEVNEWEEDYIRVVTKLSVENMDENIVKRLIILGRYNLVTETDKYGKLMVLKMPNVANFVTVKGVDLAEYYTFEISAPKNYEVIVKEDLVPKGSHYKNTSKSSM
ncbi:MULTISPECIES: hypothetical protein [unclassified Aureispira]|uniref:hypothetical protein n=1 Tax=unclassified Aureispira TaxID=2649989 RepID=UPI000695EF83|nr:MULTISPECIES: hypothetical protein [unclassified Aureispira]WMX14080.1 hypothetical protein QP953_24815 [Aureispira sp. CCB-E]